MKVGILAVQGDFEAHAEMLARMGVEHRYVFRPDDLEGCDALILPGGRAPHNFNSCKKKVFSALLRGSRSRAGQSSERARGPSCWRVRFAVLRSPRWDCWISPWPGMLMDGRLQAR